MSDEVPLGGGWSTGGVVRVGDTVRRPPEHASQLMRDVLVHLEGVGFDAAPRWLGLDEKGRDILTFLEGETFSDTRQLTWSDGQLAAAAALLRRYHDAVAGTDLAGGSEVVCHGDYGPWNLIWVDGASPVRHRLRQRPSRPAPGGRRLRALEVRDRRVAGTVPSRVRVAAERARRRRLREAT